MMLKNDPREEEWVRDCGTVLRTDNETLASPYLRGDFQDPQGMPETVDSTKP